MTVEEIFDKFDFYPESIVIYDKTNDIEFEVDQKDDPMYENTLEDYGGCEAVIWSCSRFAGSVSLHFDVEAEEK